MKPVKLTDPQYLALKKYEDNLPRNETALKIRMNVYERLLALGLVTRCMSLHSRITPAGSSALEHFETMKSRKAARK